MNKDQANGLEVVGKAFRVDGANEIVLCRNVALGATFNVNEAYYFPATYRVTKVADETSDDVEVERIEGTDVFTGCGEIAITWDEGLTRIVAVTRQDKEGCILQVLAESAPPDHEALRAENERLRNPDNWWCPEVCPVTGLPFFMWITHHKTNDWVPTYGGPYDSYTIPVLDEAGDYIRERYDHDRGGWLVDEVEDIGVQIVSNQLYTSEENPEELEAQIKSLTELSDARLAWGQKLEAQLTQSHQAAEVERLKAELAATQRHYDLETHKVITCGIIASTNQPEILSQECYAVKWNSPQAESVRKLREERDQLRALLATPAPSVAKDGEGKL